MSSASIPTVDHLELQAVKTALRCDITDCGIGVLHVPTNRVHLRPSSQTNPVGHDALVRHLQLSRKDCRGFVVAVNNLGQYVVENISGLNAAAGGPNSLQMPLVIFDEIGRAHV